MPALDFTPGERLDYPGETQVSVIDNFLPEALFEVARKESKELHKHGKGFWTNQSWPSHLIQHSTTVLVTNVQNDLINAGLRKEINKIVGDVGLQNFSVDNNANNKTALYQIWTPGSYIPWHNDVVSTADKEFSLTIYLSEHGMDDGGYYMYDDGKGIKAVKPKPNRAVLTTGGIHHCVSTVNSSAPPRRTIQMWFESQTK